MAAESKALDDLTAADLMGRDLTTVRDTMPVREAARLLMGASVHGAPVVDAEGRCVGVLSLTDLAVHAVQRDEGAEGTPNQCTFRGPRRTFGGAEVVVCQLPANTCPLQARAIRDEGGEVVACRDPNGVATDWQILEALPADDVRDHMTPDPVTVGTAATIRFVARAMIDSHVHRVIVVDSDRRPVGVVSVTDLVAAVAYAHGPVPTA